MERLMQQGVTANRRSDEYFVLEIDGRAKSGYRRFSDALRAALLLRNEFPEHDVKVRAVQATSEGESVH
jgi:hypothetical protein